MNKKILCTIFGLFSVIFVNAKKALIFGVTGQDGSYLSEFLLEKGYEVHGVRRRASTSNTSRINHLLASELFVLHYGDVTDALGVSSLICSIRPDEIYNFAAQSHVKVSFELPLHTAQVDAIGVLNILEAVRLLGCSDSVRVYQASTSELFGKVHEVPQSETTPFYPRSPYGVAKLYGFWITKNYREAWNIFACNGILFNHESPRRGDHFVTKKIARVIARISYGLEQVLYLGNLDAKRDWGHTRDYVKAMWMILQQDEPDDYVIATGEVHSVREFVEYACSLVGISIAWHGIGVDEVGINTKTGAVIVRVNPDFFRPTEVDLLLGDSTKAQEVLGWQSTISFEELVKEMVEYECMLAAKEQELQLLVKRGNTN